MNRVRHRVALLIACFVCLLLLEATAGAEAESARAPVIVLRPSSGAVEPWPEGAQAVIAELAAGGYEVTLRASAALTRDELLAELASLVGDDRVLGAVVVARDGERGIAYVCTRKDGAVRVETGVPEGAVGEGTLALRITQLLGPPRLDAPKAGALAPAPASVRAVPAPAPAAKNGLLLALEGGLALSSDLSEPLPLAALVARKSVVGPLSLDASAWLTLGASRLESSAGSVDIDAEELALHLTFDPFRENAIGVSLGLGGGVVWLQANAAAADGYSATSASTRVALLSARATGFFTHGQWSLLVAVEPGVMLPAASVGAGAEVARLGRPWTQTSVGLGWNL